MKQFEYHIESGILGKYKLNELGQKGWELVVGSNGTWIFKREIDISLADEPMKIK